MITAHVLLLEVPQLLRCILERAIAAHADFEVLKNEWGMEQPQVPPNVVILGITDAGDAALLPGLFARWPQARIMTLMPAGDDTNVYELRLGRTALGAVSPDEIVRALRGADPVLGTGKGKGKGAGIVQ